VLALTPTSLADVWGDVRRIGEAAGCAGVAANLAAELKRRVARVAEKAASASLRPRILCLEWLDPYYVGGHWVPEMAALAGGVDAFGRAGEASFRVTSEEIAASGAEVIVVMLCGYNLARTVEELRRYPIPGAWSALPAVHERRIFATDANSYFSRPGPRLANGVELLAHIFHPELFPKPPASDAVVRV
jgi:iron complex transport system substrate-binding protein